MKNSYHGDSASPWKFVLVIFLGICKTQTAISEETGDCNLINECLISNDCHCSSGYANINCETGIGKNNLPNF